DATDPDARAGGALGLAGVRRGATGLRGEDPRDRRLSARRRAEAVLLFTTAIWGTTFVGVKGALEVWPPFALMAFRFGLAALAFLPALLRPGALSARTLRRGAVLGALVFLGFSLQTVGL